MFLLLLTPVLALRNHTYHYFLYAPLAAAAWCAAAALDWVLTSWKARAARKPMRRTSAQSAPASPSTIDAAAWIFASLCVAGLTWNGWQLVRRMETRPMRVYPALRGDAIVSRAIVAENVINGLRRAALPQGVDLVFVLRERIALLSRIAHGSGEAPPPPGDIYPETNLRTALYEGYGVRALVPAATSVEFARDSIPISGRTRIVVYAPNGDLETYTASGLDSLLRTRWITRW